ncbi:MAG: GAF domain-containing protein [Flavobacteriales bacterium]|nr:GAF domain-containing protein [Flavobacteriales bacterium]
MPVQNSEVKISERYALLLKQVASLVQGEEYAVANLSNLAAVLHHEFKWFWTGFYLVRGEELVLGPFQGPVACTRIAYGKGVCGSAWEQKRSICVADVHAFPGHIACNASSRSEVVVPVVVNDKVVMVLDVDSEHLDHFSEEDRLGLEAICQYIAQEWPTWK